VSVLRHALQKHGAAQAPPSWIANSSAARTPSPGTGTLSVELLSKAATFDPDVARFTTWLHRIAINLAIDRSRRPRSDPIENAEHIAMDEPNALTNLITKEEENAIAECILQLPERQRTALALFHFEGLSGRDAAAAMEMSEKAFESLLIRARATLKQHAVRARTRARR
jgi:RNA polymerase sigma-70 factor (ECF subfamily)